ncbi:DUF4430 domain-containing protein [Paenibacillus sp. FA6]|uniref:DUF4430 domain-containing protein n=1 Tax=Paenibacillus sp. FA6 TaxID=3413029 RepID=UPI003F65E08C
MNNKRWLTALLIISVLAIAFFWGGDVQKNSTKLVEVNSETEVGGISEVASPQNMESQLDEEANSPADTITTIESDGNATKLETEDSQDLPKSEDTPAEIEKLAEKIEKEETKTTLETEKAVETDKPVSKVEESEKAVSKQPAVTPKPKVDNQETKKDKYLTDPIPKGKPKPVEWQDATINKSEELTITLSVSAKTILNNMDQFNKDKLEVLPADGIIYKAQTVTFYEGESVFDVLLREMKNNKIHMEFSMTPIYNSNYIEGINNLYEFDCGELSGWMYKVNGWFPNYGSSRYVLKDGDIVDWVYTCDLGRDIGGDTVVTGAGQ